MKKASNIFVIVNDPLALSQKVFFRRFPSKKIMKYSESHEILGDLMEQVNFLESSVFDSRFTYKILESTQIIRPFNQTLNKMMKCLAEKEDKAAFIQIITIFSRFSYYDFSLMKEIEPKIKANFPIKSYDDLKIVLEFLKITITNPFYESTLLEDVSAFLIKSLSEKTKIRSIQELDVFFNCFSYFEYYPRRFAIIIAQMFEIIHLTLQNIKHHEKDIKDILKFLQKIDEINHPTIQNMLNQKITPIFLNRLEMILYDILILNNSKIKEDFIDAFEKIMEKKDMEKFFSGIIEKINEIPVKKINFVLEGIGNFLEKTIYLTHEKMRQTKNIALLKKNLVVQKKNLKGEAKELINLEYYLSNIHIIY